MDGKLNPKGIAFAFAGVVGIAYIVCAGLLALAPELTIGFFANMFHGIDIDQIAKDDMAFGGVIIGLIEIFLISLILGWLFAKIYNAIV